MITLSIEEHERLIEEAAINAAESGYDKEYEYDFWEHSYNYISRHLGTEEWDVSLN